MEGNRRSGPGSPSEPGSSPPSPAGHDGTDVDLQTVHRVLVFISVALAFGVAAFAGVALTLVTTDVFEPFIGYPNTVRIGIAVFLTALIGVSYPLSRAAGAVGEGANAAERLGRFQTSTVVGAAVRDGAGVMGAALILLAGDIVVGGTAAVLAIVTILSGIPSRDALEAAVRERGSRQA